MWQCPQPARTGFPVCGRHGAGFAKRERAGKRENPKTASLVTGEYAEPDTRAAFLEQHPELVAAFERHFADPHILDLREELAWAKTLAAHYRERADLDHSSIMFPGDQPGILLALEAQRTVVRLAKDYVTIEKARGPLTHDDLARTMRVIGVALARFVPAEQRDACRAFIRQELAGALRRPALGELRSGGGAPGDDGADGS